MATKVLKSLKGRTLRLTKLDQCGVPIVGDCSSIVTNGFITVTYSPNYSAGTEHELKNAWGELVVSEKEPDILKWVDMKLSMCEVDPDVAEFVSNAVAVTDGTDTIGSSFGPIVNTNTYAAEVWTKQAGRACDGGAPEWGYFVTPFIVNGKLDGSLEVSNGTMTVDFMGEGVAAPADWGVNPYGDNPLLAVGGFVTGDMYSVVRTTVQPPAATDGCVALAE
jgi:hypothetical protein